MLKIEFILFPVVFSICCLVNAYASPPACHRNDISMYIHSDAVVEAVVQKSRRWSQGETLHLVAKYKIIDVFKGDVYKDEILIVTNTCLDMPVPKEMLGYPVVDNYCRNGIGLSLAGVDSKDGKPVKKAGDKPELILFLKKNDSKGAPELTWLEVFRTGFYGGCQQSLKDIPAEETEQVNRLEQRMKEIGNRK